MIRTIGKLGIVTMAAFAVAAVAPSGAFAAGKGFLTSTGPVQLTGTETEGVESVLQFEVGQTLECHGHYTFGNENETPSGFIEPPETTFTVAPQYTSCTGHTTSISAPATVTMNECDYVLRLGETASPGQWSGATDIVCPTGHEVEVHIYNSSSHATSICTYKFGGQTGKLGAEVENSGGNVRLHGTTVGISGSRTGVLCGGSKSVNNARLTISEKVSGTNEAGGATQIEITE